MLCNQEHEVCLLFFQTFVPHSYTVCTYPVSWRNTKLKHKAFKVHSLSHVSLLYPTVSFLPVDRGISAMPSMNSPGLQVNPPVLKASDASVSHLKRQITLVFMCICVYVCMHALVCTQVQCACCACVRARVRARKACTHAWVCRCAGLTSGWWVR